MKYAPHIAGAVLAVTVAGALSGAAIADTPVLKRGHHESLPETQLVKAANADLRATDRPPDHYPLETPQGTIEVAELSLHGRMRSRGGDPWWERSVDARAELNAEYDFAETASPERIAHEERLLAFTGGRGKFQQDRSPAQARPLPKAPTAPKPEPRVVRAEAPLALAEPNEVASPAPNLAASAPAASAPSAPMEARSIEIASEFTSPE